MDLRERTTNPNRHPWELSRADMILRLLAGRSRRTRYVDVGAGDCYFAERLAELTDDPVYVVDVNYAEPAVDGRLRICTNLDQVPAAAVDCAILMDVLEHVPDDAGLLRAVSRVLAPEGQVLITVPAHQRLWSSHDEFLGHYRRYDRPHLRRVVEQAGMDVVECFSFYGIPFLARAIDVGLSALGVRRRSSSAVSRWPYDPRHPITRGVRALLNGDFRLSRMLGESRLSGCGLSICATCRPTSA
jgi:SAM-dependent methyltransferase